MEEELPILQCSKGVLCDFMQAHLHNSANTWKAGFTTTVVVNHRTGALSCGGIAHNKNSKESDYINFCPWCGVSMGVVYGQ